VTDTARDLLEQDMARHEREVNGTEVHAARNATLAAEALAIAERMRESTPVAHAETSSPQTFTQRRELNGHTYVIDKAGSSVDVAFRTTTEFERNVLKHAQPRIALLLSKPDEGPLGQPSWRTRTMAALYFKIKAAEAIQSGKPDETRVYEMSFQQDLYELLESSNQTFGDWRKGAPQKLIIASR
jgi:hypothetical protein